MKKGNLIAALLCLVMLLTLIAGCGGSDSEKQNTTSPPTSGTSPSNTSPSNTPSPTESAASGKDTLRIAVEADAGTLDPIGLSQGGYTQVAYCYMEPLWDYRSNGDMVWLLATSVDEVSPTQVTVHLREGVTFSNGNPLTAEDVLFTFELWRDTPNRATTLTQVDFEKTNVVNDLTLDLHFIAPAVNKMIMLGLVTITDAESYDPVDFSLHPVGTGPYVVAEYVVNSHMNAKAREDYWGEKPAIANLQFKVLAEESQRINALQTNTVDIAEVPNQDVDYAKGLSEYNIEFYYGAATRHILFNVNEASIFSNVDARYAVCHAIDKQAIKNIVYNGYADVASNPVSKYAGDYEPRFENMHDTYSIGYDPDLAKQYAESSGLVDKEVRIMTNGTSEFVAMAEIIQASLKAIGVTATINNYDQATLRANYRTEPSFYDICLYFTGTPDNMVGSLLQRTITSSAILTGSDWEGRDRFLELCAEVIVVGDKQERLDVIYEMLQIFTEACLWYGVSDLARAFASSTDINNMGFYSQGGIRYQELSFA